MSFTENFISFFSTLWGYISPFLQLLYKYTLEPIINKFASMLKFINTHRALSFGIIILVVYVILSYLFMFKYNYLGFNKFSYITNILFIIVGVGFGFALLNKYFSPNDGIQPTFMNVVKRMSILLFALFLLFGLIYIISYASFYSDTLTIFITIGISLFALYFINKTINNLPVVQAIKRSPFFSILYHTLFLIPCLLIDGTINVYNDIQSTPTIIFRILVIEILLILAYFLLPYIIKKIYTHDSKLLLNKPLYLDKQHKIASFEDLSTKEFSKNEYKYNYGISAWVFLDNIGGNHNYNATGFMNIINYGDKPKIQYNPKTQTLRITTQQGIDGTEVIYEDKHLPLQRWNHFVVNYNNGNMDIFINSKLVGTKNGIVPYMIYDNVIIGQENGMEGGICNIQYFHNPLTKSTIDFDYKMLKHKTPPIIS
jgi:hypothetical protein